MIYKGHELVDRNESLRNFFLVALAATHEARGGTPSGFWREEYDVRLTVNGEEFDLEGAIANFDAQINWMLGQRVRDELEAIGYYKLANFMQEFESSAIYRLKEKARELGIDIAREEDYR